MNSDPENTTTDTKSYQIKNLYTACTLSILEGNPKSIEIRQESELYPVILLDGCFYQNKKILQYLKKNRRSPLFPEDPTIQKKITQYEHFARKTLETFTDADCAAAGIWTRIYQFPNPADTTANFQVDCSSPISLGVMQCPVVLENGRMLDATEIVNCINNNMFSIPVHPNTRHVCIQEPVTKDIISAHGILARCLCVLTSHLSESIGDEHNFEHILQKPSDVPSWITQLKMQSIPIQYTQYQACLQRTEERIRRLDDWLYFKILWSDPGVRYDCTHFFIYLNRMMREAPPDRLSECLINRLISILFCFPLFLEDHARNNACSEIILFFSVLLFAVRAWSQFIVQTFRNFFGAYRDAEARAQDYSLLSYYVQFSLGLAVMHCSAFVYLAACFMRSLLLIVPYPKMILMCVRNLFLATIAIPVLYLVIVLNTIGFIVQSSRCLARSIGTMFFRAPNNQLGLNDQMNRNHLIP